MISKNVPHTYIADGVRYFAILCSIETKLPNGKSLRAYNFFIIDEEGYCWLQMIHTTRSFVFQLGNGILRTRTIWEVEDSRLTNCPIVDLDEWVDGIADRGYALEIVREGLGLDLEILLLQM